MALEMKHITFGNADELIECLLKYIVEDNQEGYIIFIDEIHVVLKDLFGKNEDNDFMTFLSQLRKFGIYIIGTAQIYSRCPRTVREYIRLNGQIILCKKLIAGTTLLKFVDMTTCEEDSRNNLKCSIARWKFYFHTVELYKSYDTFAIISQIKNLIKKEDKQ